MYIVFGDPDICTYSSCR